MLAVQAPPIFAASHREAPITALDQKADITDWFAFVSPEHPDRVIMILNVDPFLEPSNGPNYFPFDPGILYEMKIDNNHDGVPDITFQFRFQTQIQIPACLPALSATWRASRRSPRSMAMAPQGLGLRQTYSVTMVTSAGSQCSPTTRSCTPYRPMWAPHHAQLRAALISRASITLYNGIRVFAGTVADPSSST